TPEAFVLDARGEVRYRGRIDDQYGVGTMRPKPTRRDLAEALTELLAGKPVSKPRTEAVGCRIGRLPEPARKGDVTYAKQVSRIWQKTGRESHRPGEVGPFSLLTYEQARDWSGTIREVVADRRMPPWHADPKHGQFANDRSLPRKDIDTLLAWIDAG